MKDLLSKKLQSAPEGPGCYVFRDSKGRVLYVGKAKSIRARVRTYFQAQGSIDPKTAALVSKISDVDFLVTDLETEALLLEANLIREHKPRYNITLKDDKRYPYLKVTTQEPFPRLLVVRRVAQDGAAYFGPYTNVTAMRRMARLISRVFMIRSCDLVIPPPGKRTYRVCLDYYIKRCPGPCEFKTTVEDYGRLIQGACLFLSGRSRELLEELRARMEKASAEERFEEAALLRDQIDALTEAVHKQKVVSEDGAHRDIIAFAREGKDAVVVALQIRDGVLLGRQEFHLVGEATDGEAAMLSAFVKQYYLHAPQVPDEVVLPVEIEEADLISSFLAESKQTKIRWISPRRGTKRELVAMAQENARLVLADLLLQRRGRSDRTPPSVAALAEVVVLDTPPRTIAAFDISHLGAGQAVAACVVFENGQPKKSEYRRFKLASQAPDDYAAMREVVGRYFRRRLEEKLPLPDLVLVDGGRGQLTSAAEALFELGLADLPLVGLAKRLDELVFPYESDTRFLPRTSPALRLLQRLRDEAHRFANSYQAKGHRNELLESELDRIPGVGAVRRTALLSHFGSASRLAAATVEEMAAVPGVGPALARTIHEHFQAQRTESEAPRASA